MCIAAGDEFPSAVTAVLDWLQPVDHPYLLVHLLLESMLCVRFPAESLFILSATTTDEPWIPEDLRECLTQIIQAKPELSADAGYRQLWELVRRRGN